MWELIWRGSIIGIGATLAMDLWAMFLTLAFRQPKANWAPVGRWFYHLKFGTVFHQTIADAAPYRHEQALGWIAHYAVGIAYGSSSSSRSAQAGLPDQPCCRPGSGRLPLLRPAGSCCSRALGSAGPPRRRRTRTRSRALNLLAHTAFGLGLWLTALLIR